MNQLLGLSSPPTRPPSWPLAKPEWYVLVSKPAGESNNALGLSVRRADDVTIVRRLGKLDKETFSTLAAGKGMGTTAFMHSLIGFGTVYPDAFETLSNLLRPAAPALAPALPPLSWPSGTGRNIPRKSSLTGAVLLGRGSGSDGGGLSTPPPGPKLPASLTGSAPSLRPRLHDLSAAATASASELPAKRESKPKPEPRGTPPSMVELCLSYMAFRTAQRTDQTTPPDPPL